MAFSESDQSLQFNHLEIAIHLDFHLDRDSKYTLTDVHRNLRERWLQRSLSLSDDSVVIYYSSIYPSYADPDWDPYESEVHQAEQARIRVFEGALGKRFIYIPGQPLPNEVDISSILGSRKLTYDPRELTIVSYGEWYEVCVQEYGKALTEALGVPISRLKPLLELSVSKFSKQK